MAQQINDVTVRTRMQDSLSRPLTAIIGLTAKLRSETRQLQRAQIDQSRQETYQRLARNAAVEQARRAALRPYPNVPVQPHAALMNSVLPGAFGFGQAPRLVGQPITPGVGDSSRYGTTFQRGIMSAEQRRADYLNSARTASGVPRPPAYLAGIAAAQQRRTVREAATEAERTARSITELGRAGTRSNNPLRSLVSTVNKLSGRTNQDGLKNLNSAAGATIAQFGRFRLTTGKTWMSVGELSSKISGLVTGFGSFVFGGVSAVTKGLGALGAAAVATGVSFASGLEQARVAINALAGESQGAEFFNFAKNMSLKTPFAITDVTTAMRMALTSGAPTDQIENLSKQVLNFAAASGDPSSSGRLARALGQISSSSAINGQDLLQLQNAGVNWAQIIADNTGKSVQKVFQARQKGNLDTVATPQQLIKWISDGSGSYMQRIQGVAEAQAKTVSGVWNLLKNNVRFALADASQPLVSALEGDLPKLTSGLVEMATKGGGAIFTMLGHMVDWATKVIPMLTPIIVNFFTGIGNMFSGINADTDNTRLQKFFTDLADAVASFTAAMTPEAMSTWASVLLGALGAVPPFVVALQGIIPPLTTIAGILAWVLGSETVQKILGMTAGFAVMAMMVGGPLLLAMTEFVGILDKIAHYTGLKWLFKHVFGSGDDSSGPVTATTFSPGLFTNGGPTAAMPWQTSGITGLVAPSPTATPSGMKAGALPTSQAPTTPVTGPQFNFNAGAFSGANLIDPDATTKAVQDGLNKATAEAARRGGN